MHKANDDAGEGKTGRGAGNLDGRSHKIPYPNRSDAVIRRTLRFSADDAPKTPVRPYASEHFGAVLDAGEGHASRFTRLTNGVPLLTARRAPNGRFGSRWTVNPSRLPRTVRMVGYWLMAPNTGRVGTG